MSGSGVLKIFQSAHALLVPPVLAVVMIVAVPAPAVLGQAGGGGNGDTDWDLPDSVLGRRLGQLLDMLSGDDAALTREFVKTVLTPDFLEMGPMEMHLEQFASMRETLGTFTVDDIRIQGLRADLVLASGDGSRTDLHVELQDIEPHRIAGLGMRPHDPDLEIPEFTDLDQVHAYLTRLGGSNKFAGVILVDQKDTSEFLHAYGMANKVRGAENTPGTRFNVGSITKSFTALAVMQLVEAGKIGLDDPMSKYLPQFPSEIADRVTVRHLLRMESGYGDYFGSPVFQARRPVMRTIDDFLNVFKGFTLDFDPGTDQEYSNTGYTILGGIIEKASGMTYFDYVKKNIFEPAGMTGSGFPEYRAANDDPTIAMGYTNDGPRGLRGYRETNLELFTVRGNPSGGSYSTARDLVRYNRALRGNKLLGAESTTLLLNFFQEGKERPTRRGIAGGAPGVSAVLLEDTKAGCTVIVLSNYDEPLGENIGQAVFTMVRGEP
jgi:CubicO group peptidase (beta-lactamase class C family)